MMMQTEAMRSAKYVSVLRERFGADAADRVEVEIIPAGSPVEFGAGLEGVLARDICARCLAEVDRCPGH